MSEKPSDLPVEGMVGWLWDERLEARGLRVVVVVVADDTSLKTCSVIMFSWCFSCPEDFYILNVNPLASSSFGVTSFPMLKFFERHCYVWWRRSPFALFWWLYTRSTWIHPRNVARALRSQRLPTNQFFSICRPTNLGSFMIYGVRPTWRWTVCITFLSSHRELVKNAIRCRMNGPFLPVPIAANFSPFFFRFEVSGGNWLGKCRILR